MTSWPKLVHEWTWARISDAEFIRLAYAIGFGPRARELVAQDLETP